jgi:hypothetical protein
MSTIEVAGLDFGKAIDALKDGRHVSRAGWNGKNMCVFLSNGSLDIDSPLRGGDENMIDGVDINLFDLGDVGTITRMPSLSMVSASGNIVVGWLASQTDMLAEDWQVIAD